ncbi:TPA: hypothetical protein ACYU26_002251 [Enterobacter ludwigii]
MSNIDKQARDKLKQAAAKAVDNFDPNMFVETRDVLALLDEMEAKDRMVAEFLNIISRHTIELGWGEKPITLAELIIYREGSGSDALDAIRAAAAGKGE